jgi:hypothetical protein
MAEHRLSQRLWDGVALVIVCVAWPFIRIVEHFEAKRDEALTVNNIVSFPKERAERRRRTQAKDNAAQVIKMRSGK